MGTSIRLDSSRIYKAVHATNQPKWKEKGLVFALLPGTIDDSFLLSREEYDLISE